MSQLLYRSFFPAGVLSVVGGGVVLCVVLCVCVVGMPSMLCVDVKFEQHSVHVCLASSS
jgi:hypothetical protein